MKTDIIFLIVASYFVCLFCVLVSSWVIKGDSFIQILRSASGGCLATMETLLKIQSKLSFVQNQAFPRPQNPEMLRKIRLLLVIQYHNQIEFQSFIAFRLATSLI